MSTSLRLTNRLLTHTMHCRKYLAYAKEDHIIHFVASERRPRIATISPPPSPHGPTGKKHRLPPISILTTTSYSLHATYRRLIPAIEVCLYRHLVVQSISLTHAIQIEILPAGEEGPRRLDEATTMMIRGIPFLTVSEFIRAKLRTWAMYVTVLSHIYSQVTNT